MGELRNVFYGFIIWLISRTCHGDVYVIYDNGSCYIHSSLHCVDIRLTMAVYTKYVMFHFILCSMTIKNFGMQALAWFRQSFYKDVFNHANKRFTQYHMLLWNKVDIHVTWATKGIALDNVMLVVRVTAEEWPHPPVSNREITWLTKQNVVALNTYISCTQPRQNCMSVKK